MSKRRRILKRSGVVTSVMILGMWAFSIAWGVSWFSSTKRCYIIRGVVGVQHIDMVMDYRPRHPGWHIFWGRMDEPSLYKGHIADTLGFCAPTIEWHTWSEEQGDKATNISVAIPLWLPFIIVALPTAFMYYRDRKRIPPGHCAECGYNLTGAEHERCPECGAACD